MNITFAKTSDNENINILSNKINQHGLICGATGSGKTVTLKVLAESFSELGIPVILSDVKGDLANLCKAGSPNDKIIARLEELNIYNFNYSAYPVELWDTFGEKGLPLRINVSEMGPIILSQILGLNDTQAGILNIAFRIADSMGLLLLDLKDLTSILKLMSEKRQEFSSEFGNISNQSINAIRRKLLYLEDLGADLFFNEPSLDIRDLFRKDDLGRGYINILSSEKLINNPTVYSMFLLWLLSELFEELPEVGDQNLPKLVFFFDEAHLLFNNSSEIILEKINQVVRLIRSKGIGIYFVTQNPMDIPDSISSQLGNKIIHQLRAFSPKEMKNIRDISKTLRQDENLNLENDLSTLRTGEAIISTIDVDGSPTFSKKALIFPPHSSFETLTQTDYNDIINLSKLNNKYKKIIDRESAYEILQRKFKKIDIVDEKKANSTSKDNKDFISSIFNSFAYTISRQIGREIARGIIGSIKKRK